MEFLTEDELVGDTSPASVKGGEESTESSFEMEPLGNLQVLFVDDEPHILKAFRRLTSGRDYEVLTAENGETALSILREHPVAVLITDQRMPGISGSELLEIVRGSDPQVVRIMLTGNNDITTALEAINQGAVFRFVTKPWDHTQILRIIELALDQYRLQVSRERYEQFIERQNAKLLELNDRLASFNEELEERVDERTAELRAQKREVARLYQELDDSFDGMINALLCVMELGEIHVVEHCQRTAEQVRRFADEMGMDEELVHELERAAMLHWIGLISAPSSLLEKPVEQFDPVELASWEFHPLLGQQALYHVPALSAAGRTILYYLHRYDDRDFQPGVLDSNDNSDVLSEDFIRGCQILKIVSTFERSRTIRRKASRNSVDDSWIKAGIKALQAGRGTEFDPGLVDEFLQWVLHDPTISGTDETMVSFDQLQPGMVLSRPVETSQGSPLAPRDITVTAELIERLDWFRETNGLKSIHIWK